MLGLAKEGDWKFLWVHSAPMFDHDEESNRWTSVHHPFTAPYPEDLDKLESDPGAARSQSYDLVLNGVELGGGSVRIHDPETQEVVFKALGLGPEEVREKFGFFVDALKYGAPPHAGLAFGLDRLVMLMTNSTRSATSSPSRKHKSLGHHVRSTKPSCWCAAARIELGQQRQTARQQTE